VLEPLTGASPEAGGTNAAAGTDSAGKLATPSGALAVGLGAPDLIPRPELRASAEPAPVVKGDLKLTSAEPLPQSAKAPAAAAQGLRDSVRDSSPGQALGLREGLLRARISEEPSSSPTMRT